MALPRLALVSSLLLPIIGATAQEPVLSARPGLCIMQDADSQECVMGVELSWRGPAGSYCLYHSNAAAPLRCWDNSTEGTHSTELASREDVSYWLQRPPADEHLAEITVRVVSLAQRRPERRRRHAWAPL